MVGPACDVVVLCRSVLAHVKDEWQHIKSSPVALSPWESKFSKTAMELIDKFWDSDISGPRRVLRCWECHRLQLNILRISYLSQGEDIDLCQCRRAQYERGHKESIKMHAYLDHFTCQFDRQYQGLVESTFEEIKSGSGLPDTEWCVFWRDASLVFAKFYAQHLIEIPMDRSILNHREFLQSQMHAPHHYMEALFPW